MASISYEYLIDWDGTGALNIGSFETGLDGWAGFGTASAPTLMQDGTRSYDGDYSLKIVWSGGLENHAHRNITGEFVIGRSYTFSAWVWVPAGDLPLKLAVPGFPLGSASTVNDAWQKISVTFTATKAKHNLQVWASGGVPPAGDAVWVDRVRLLPPGGDVSSRVLAQPPVTISYGRDQARALSPTSPGQASFALTNLSGDYYPDNSSSPLYGLVGPGRQVQIKATFAGDEYSLFQGSIDDFDTDPSPGARPTTFQLVDALATLADIPVSTPLYQGITTGEALTNLLDAVGWPPDARDLDPGVSVLPWWWAEGPAGDAAAQLVRSEGPTAFVTIAPDGSFLFRDRHHRLLRSASTTVQATYRNSGADPRFSDPLGYSHGAKDIINSVTFDVEERRASPDLEDVWTSEDALTIADGTTTELVVTTQDPFFGAIVPQAGTDFVKTGSGTLTVTLNGFRATGTAASPVPPSRWSHQRYPTLVGNYEQPEVSGQTATIRMTAAGGPVIVTGLKMRAFSVSVAATRRVHWEDSRSVDTYGVRPWPDEVPLTTPGHAEAIAHIILAHRSERRPTVQVRLTGGNDTIKTQQLARDLSDRVGVVDSRMGLNGEFHIEQIAHSIHGAGNRIHETVFGCERAVAQATGVFILGTSLLGTGKLGKRGLDDPASMFVLGSSLLGTGILGT